VRCVEEVDALFQKDMAILQALSLSKSGLVSDLLTGSVSVPEAMSRQWKSGRSGNHD
jgi:hypothetical protein